MTAKEKVLADLKDTCCVRTTRHMAIKLHLEESTVRRAANILVKEGSARRTSMWTDVGWHYRRAGYIAVYRYVGTV